MTTQSDSTPAMCTCELDALDTRTEQFSVTPARGGGWAVWAEAFTRLLHRLVTGSAHCVIVTQDPNQRYVQMMVGHGHAHIEAASNTYLMGDFRLDEREERLLEVLGFEPPGSADTDPQLPDNWWCDHERVDPEAIAGLVLATLTGAMGFIDRYPVAIEIFGAASPCAACFWTAA